jgi:MULE transposase domain
MAYRDDPSEVGDDTLFGSTIQKIGEPQDSLMRAPDTRLFKEPEFIHNIDSLIEKMNLEWCGPRGYAVSIRRHFYADKEKLEPNKVKFYCTRGRNYQTDLSNWSLDDLQDHSALKRNRSTLQRCDCPFGGYFRRFAKTPSQWDLVITNGTHNHEPELDERAIPALRRVCRSRGIRAIVEEKTVEGLSLSAIYDACLQTGLLAVTKRDILNIQAGMRIHRLGGLTPTQALLTRLRDHPDYRYHFHVDDDGYLTRLLVFEQGSLEILRSNFEVLLVDPPCRTNWFDMPQFDIVGATVIGTSFSVGFCFLDGEDEGNFRWVLEKLRCVYDELGIRHPIAIITGCDTAFLKAREIVFPLSDHLLCTRHVFKSILAHCKTEFRRHLAAANPSLSTKDLLARVAEASAGLLPDIECVFYAETAAEYQTAWNTFKAKWLSQHPWVPNHIEDTWLKKHKTMIVPAWTRHVLHFGNTASHGGHTVIKDAARNSGGDLDKILSHLLAIFRRQQGEYRAELARQMASRPPRLLNPIYRLVLGRVSSHALLKTEEIIQSLRGLQAEHQAKYKDENIPFALDPCACSDSTGIPCIHRIHDWLTQGVSLPLEDFHEHWSLERSADRSPLDPSLFIHEPQERIVKGKVRKRSRQSRWGNSMIREPTTEARGHGQALDNDRNVAAQPIKRRRKEPTVVAPGGNLEYEPEYAHGGRIIQF